MKKKCLILLLIALLTMLLAACGNSSSGNESPGAGEEATAVEEPAEAEVTVESYMTEHPEELASIKETINQNEDIKDVMTVDVTADGNDVYYIYTFYETYTEEQIEAALPNLEQTLEGMQDSLKEQIASMESSLGIDGIRLIFEYHNGDGSLIYSSTVE